VIPRTLRWTAARAICLASLASNLPSARAFQSGEPAPAAVTPADAAKPDAAKKEDSERSLIDPVDGWFDLSPFLEHAAGFVPLIVPITEPALGYGAVFAAVFLDPREEAGSEGWSRPNISMLGGLATEDGSEGLFAANSTLWGDGDVQTLIGVGKVGLELSLYGVGNDPSVADHPIDYGLDAEGFVGEVRRRFGDSKWWGGLRLVYARSEVDFEDPRGGVAGAGAEDEGVTLAGPALTLRYDSLDNFFTPTSGTLWDNNVSFFDDSFGGSRDFQTFQEILIHHWTLAPDFFLGARGQFDASFGDTPFYVRPYIQLRGIPSLRYQGEEAASVELELRWQFHPRFSAVGFGGTGWAWTDFEDVDRSQNASAGGVGMRYMIAREFGLHAGLDVAYGPEEGAVYVQFGNAWVRP
jgi:hypothetical protein